ncbi:hypothetical protein [Paenarthrobacter sp. PH39-S1]|uniref:hypothetical protein n=1 Tax=Paenarthrobacter sp. PH39-S1 TaxID=3046204 RepID=UPI0024B8D63F|nr:hypothetical protein [Paenarthrobacter sp. PH39-S1]MDJ0355291.1 hypothetical protein [Paenarthrobacter sp. PH39-S1]
MTTAEWDAATANRYHSLAAQNEAHFAPSSSDLAPVSGKSAFDHKSAYEDYHWRAIRASQGGNRDSALILNSFADHFLTDAFAAGHLFNKRDVMQLFNSRLPMNASNEFTAASVAFFDAVATRAWTGDVAREFSRYETVEFKGAVFRPNIDSEGRFSKLLQGIHQKEPDLMANVVAKSVHDTLNRAPGGVPVTNNLGDAWSLSGDKTMNPQTQLIARRAVAQSLLDVLEVFKTTTSVGIASLTKRAWDYVPQLTAVGKAETARAVTSGIDPASKGLIEQAAALLSENYRLIIAELVKRKILKPA